MNARVLLTGASNTSAVAFFDHLKRAAGPAGRST